jgi:carbon-monoxide dehydrogenase small subunit
MSTHTVPLTVDGTAHTVEVEPRELLVHTLRDGLDYTAPKVGCESAKCGACTVRLDGRTVKACNVLTVQADGGTITTAAGLADGDDRHPVQDAFHDEHALQCGYCTPGMVVRAVELLDDHDDPDRDTVREELKGNVCRCTGYANVVDAVQRAASEGDD